MMSLIFTPAAEGDIDQIYDYTEENWGSEQAERYIFGIRDQCEALSQGLRRGRALDRIKRDYLALAFQSHFIVYRYSPGAITIVRILHRRMNVLAHL